MILARIFRRSVTSLYLFGAPVAWSSARWKALTSFQINLVKNSGENQSLLYFTNSRILPLKGFNQKKFSTITAFGDIHFHMKTWINNNVKNLYCFFLVEKHFCGSGSATLRKLNYCMCRQKIINLGQIDTNNKRKRILLSFLWYNFPVNKAP